MLAKSKENLRSNVKNIMQKEDDPVALENGVTDEKK